MKYVSPLLAKIHAGAQGLRRPGDVPTEMAVPSTPAKLAFCPLRKEATGVGMCDEVTCRDCPILRVRIEDAITRWCCSGCTTGRKVEAYYADGNCEDCGDYSIVLVLTLME